MTLPEPVFKPQLNNLGLLIAVALEDRIAKVLAYVIVRAKPGTTYLNSGWAAAVGRKRFKV